MYDICILVIYTHTYISYISGMRFRSNFGYIFCPELAKLFNLAH